MGSVGPDVRDEGHHQNQSRTGRMRRQFVEQPPGEPGDDQADQDPTTTARAKVPPARHGDNAPVSVAATATS